MTTISRARIGLPDMAWVTWRQHRTVISVTALFAVAAAVFTAWTTSAIRSEWDASEFPHRVISYRPVEELSILPAVLSGVIAVFWTAPMLVREYEHRTHLVAWGQDISPRRWLAGKVIVMTVIATVLSAGVTMSTTSMRGTLEELESSYNGQPLDSIPFETSIVLQACYTVFGLALGLVFSALSRNTVVAMALTLVGFAVFRTAVALFAREHYLPPFQGFRPWDPPGVNYVPQVPPDGHRIDSGYADAAGNPYDLPANVECSGEQACLEAHGVAGHYATWQPADRVPVFQLIESGLFVLLAVALFALAFHLVKRRNRI